MKRVIITVLIMVSLAGATVVYQTDFEDCTDSIPPGWTLVDNNGDSHYFAAESNSSYAHSGNWYIRYKAQDADSTGDDWAISDSFYLQGNMEDTLVFYYRARSSSHRERLQVYLMRGITPYDTVMMLFQKNNITNTSYRGEEIIFRPPASGYYRIGFYSNSRPDPEGWEIIVDDVSVLQADSSGSSLGNNLAIDAVYPFLTGWRLDRVVDTVDTFTIVVKNYGIHRFGPVSIKYKIDSAGVNIVPETQIAVDTIDGGETKVYTFSFSPLVNHMVEYDIYVFHDKYNDSQNQYRKDDTFHMHFIVEGHQGKDAYGWVFRDSRSILGNPGVSWIELRGDPLAMDLSLSDDGDSTVNLAAPIRYYGSVYEKVKVNANGIMIFSGGPSYSYNNDSIPSSTAGISIMPFWDDLDPSSGGAVYYRTIDDTLTVVEWYQVPRFGVTSNTFTFEVQIQSNQESNGIYDNITFLYYNMEYDEDNMDATIGIQGPSGTGYVYYTYNEQPYVPNWKNSKGIFVIKFYAPEALGINAKIAYDFLGKARTIFALHNMVKVAEYNPDKVFVFNISGQRVPVRKMFKNGKFFIDFSGLKNGIYYIMLHNNEGKERLKVLNLK